MTRPGTTVAATHSDHTYAIAERLRGITIDSLYTFEPGVRDLSVATFPEHLTLIGRFTQHSWGVSAQVWARGGHGTLQAGAEASAGPLAEVSSIRSRIKHFRSGALLWTHIARPVLAPIDPFPGSAYTAIGRHCYRLHPEPRIDAHPIWHLSTDDLDLEHPLFAGVASAVTYIADQLENPTANRKKHKTASPAAAHPWRR
jgi:hypothetical protein